MARRVRYHVPYEVELAEYLEAGAAADGAGLGPTDARLAARALRLLDRLKGGYGRRRVVSRVRRPAATPEPAGGA